MKLFLITYFISITILFQGLDFEKIIQKQIIEDIFPKQKQIIEKIFYYSDKYSVDPYLSCALAFKESSFNRFAYHNNYNGSIDRGIFQLNNYSYPNLTKNQFYDPEINIKLGIKHIKNTILKGKSTYAGLSIYNCGRILIKSIYAEKIIYIQNLYYNLFYNTIKKIKQVFFHFISLTSCPALEKSRIILCRQEDLFPKTFDYTNYSD